MQNIPNNLGFNKVLGVFIILLLFLYNSHAQDNRYRKLMTLPTQWKFTIGDNSE